MLRGAPAVVAAIDRRAVARAVREPGPLSPFLAGVAAALDRDPAAVRVDSSALSTGGRKLGLGSSAAATVAFAGALAPELDRAEIHALAHRVHGDVSARGGARGSGIDVAASVWGGLLSVTPRGGGPPATRALALPRDLTWIAVDSGAPADTRELVCAVMQRAGEPELAAIAEAAESLAAATSAAAALEAIEAGMGAIAALGEQTGVALITGAIAEIAAIARACGGAAKPTGAAGGDIVFAAFAAEADARRFCGDLEAAGISRLELALDRHGLLQNQAPGGMFLTGDPVK